MILLVLTTYFLHFQQHTMLNKKVFCLYHPDSPITNFCKNKQCLMPLCPVCIREHAEYHLQTHTKPSYFSIAETVQDVEKNILQTIQQLERHQNKLGHIIKENYEFHQSIKERLEEAKQAVLSWVEEKFHSFEVETLKKLNSMMEEKGIKSIEQTNTHYQQLQLKINDYYKMFQSLQTERFLATIISFLKLQATQISKSNRLYASFIDSQARILPKLTLNLDIKSHFMSTIEKLIRITVQQKQRQRSPRTSPLQSNRMLNSSRFGRTEKNQNLYTPQNSARFLKDKNSQTKRIINNKPSNSPYYLHARYQQANLSQSERLGSPFLLSHRTSQRPKPTFDVCL